MNPKLTTSFLAILCHMGIATAGLNDIVSIDPSLTYRILPDFEGNVTEGFIDTATSNSSVSSVFAAARNSTFISYSSEFLSILGPNPILQLVEQRNYSFANEAGIWVPDRNEVWFTSSSIDDVTLISVLNLQTLEVYTPNTSIPIVNPNGGYSLNNIVYFAGDGNATVPPAIYAIDPSTGQSSIIINSYFGIPFNGPNDMVWVSRNNENTMFFTDDPLSSLYNGGPPPVLVDAVWRFSPSQNSLVPVISRADILVPNGIAVNKDFTKLYVTDTLPITPSDAAANFSGSNAIFEFDLSTDMLPVNKRLLGISRTGIPDGFKVDDMGRVWTGEGEGIVVRNAAGRVIGIFNAETLLDPVLDGGVPIANFALAGDVLVIEANERLWTLKLGEVVMDGGKFYS
jgi:gluconolactonase